jgi:hypothetical protein
MEPMRALPSIVLGTPQVTERRGGGQKREQAEAFRRALQQSAGEAGKDSDGRPDSAAGQTPMRRTLQVPGGPGRKDEATARHVDVIA